MAQDKQKKRHHSQPAMISSEAEPIVGDAWLGWAFALLSLIVFAATTCPTVPGGDSGELISVAHNLGVAHPPGYPLYTLLGHLATYLPFGSIAWRVNFLSALLAVGSGLFIYAVVTRWLRDRWLAVAAAALFIFSPLAWRYAVVAEVFALNNLFVGALLYMTLRFLEKPGLKTAMGWAVTLGFACSHHHTILFLAIPIFFLLLRRHSSILLRPKVFVLCSLMFVVGLLPYLYLPIAAKKNLLISWGRADTWEGFWIHFLRKEYGTFQLATGDKNYLNVFSNLKFYVSDFWLQMLIVGGLVSVLAFWQTLRGSLRQDPFSRLLLWSFLMYVIGFHTMANMDMSNRLFYDVQSRFWLLPNLILALFFAAGLKWLFGRCPQWATQLRVLTVVLVLGLQIGVHYEREDHSRNTVFYDLGKGLLDGMPKGALAFQRGDVYVNAIRYLQSVENYRTDVMSIPFDLLWWPWTRGVVEANFPGLKFPGKVYRYMRTAPGEYTLKDFFELNQHLFPSFIGKLSDPEIKTLSQSFDLIPVGYMNRIVQKGKPFDFKMFKEDSERFAGFNPPKKEQIREKSWEAFIYYNYWDREGEKARMLFDHAINQGENFDLLVYGAGILERMIREYPETAPATFRNLGVAYQLMGKRDPRYFTNMINVWRRYLAMGPTDDKQLPIIRRAVEAAGNVSLTPAPDQQPKIQ
jgi:hypothetical protein